MIVGIVADDLAALVGVLEGREGRVDGDDEVLSARTRSSASAPACPRGKKGRQRGDGIGHGVFLIMVILLS